MTPAILALNLGLWAGLSPSLVSWHQHKFEQSTFLNIFSLLDLYIISVFDYIPYFKKPFGSKVKKILFPDNRWLSSQKLSTDLLLIPNHSPLGLYDHSTVHTVGCIRTLIFSIYFKTIFQIMFIFGLAKIYV